MAISYEENFIADFEHQCIFIFTGINIFLDGFVPTENLRFRETSLVFKVAETADKVLNVLTLPFSLFALLVLEFPEVLPVKITQSNGRF